MMGQFFTGDDIRRLGREQGCRYLLLAPEDSILYLTFPADWETS